jgi:hypothetical protein
MSNRWIGGVLGVLGLSIFLYPTQTKHRASSTHHMDELRAEVAQVRADLTEEQIERERRMALEAQIGSNERTRGSYPTAPAGASAAARPANLPAVEPARAPDAGARVVGESEEYLMEAFAAESADPTWARAAEDTIEYKLSEQLPSASTIQSVECRTLLCRIATVHHDETLFGEFLMNAFKDPDKRIWPGEAFTLQSSRAGGEVVAVSYLAREGESLPTR